MIVAGHPADEVAQAKSAMGGEMATDALDSRVPVSTQGATLRSAPRGPTGADRLTRHPFGALFHRSQPCRSGRNISSKAPRRTFEASAYTSWVPARAFVHKSW
jgi:hypothetical protein